MEWGRGLELDLVLLERIREMVLTYAQRVSQGVVGLVGSTLAGAISLALGIGLHAGINLFNMLVVGVLGLPGIGLLYAVLAIKTL